jgi:SAM-dependent methyltransferase
MIALIRDGVPEPGGVWADLGAGTGNFTWALRQLLGAHGTIYALDRDARAIARQHEVAAAATEPGATIIARQADITHPLDLPPLDGVLLANVLHFIRDQSAMLAHAAGYLRPGGHFLLVEYDLQLPRTWVPFPVAFERFQSLADGCGLAAPTLIGTRRSPSSGVVMYAAHAVRLA